MALRAFSDQRKLLRFGLLAAGALGALVFFLLFPRLEEKIAATFQAAGALVDAHPLVGSITFILFAIVSATFAFFSSAALVPAAVAAWGEATTFALLFLGWLLGAVIAYLIGKYWGRKAVARFTALDTIDAYQKRISGELGFFPLLLFRFALPSEVPSYIFGIGRYDFGKYLLLTVLTEAPFAAAAVYAGQSLLVGRRFAFTAVILAALGLVGLSFFLWHKHFHHHEP